MQFMYKFLSRTNELHFCNDHFSFCLLLSVDNYGISMGITFVDNFVNNVDKCFLLKSYPQYPSKKQAKSRVLHFFSVDNSVDNVESFHIHKIRINPQPYTGYALPFARECCVFLS